MTNQTFEKLGLDDTMMNVLNSKGFTEPTEIQKKTIPMILAGQDVIASSSTGSGKTLAFGLGVIQRLEKGQGVQLLVLAPTRELAEQIVMVLHEFAKPRGLRSVSIYGGVSMNPQINALRSADIVVATPGRLLDHMSRGTISLDNARFVILDEADRMLDMGFLPDVSKILKVCPVDRQMLLFTATLPTEVTTLANQFMKNPQKVRAGEQVDPTKLKQVYYDVQGGMKFSLLVHLLNEERKGLVMVFCNSRRYVDQIENGLNKNNIDAMAIHGGLTQQARKNVLDRFHKGHKFVLVCTDVAARGLDIPNISHVYNFDIPKDSKQYMHRIGRTARAGSEGCAINLIASRDYDNFSRVLQDNDVKIEKMKRPYVERVELPEGGRHRPSTFGGRGGQRGGRGGERSNTQGGNRGGYHGRSGNDRGGRGAGYDREAPRRSRGGSYGSDGENRSRGGSYGSDRDSNRSGGSYGGNRSSGSGNGGNRGSYGSNNRGGNSSSGSRGGSRGSYGNRSGGNSSRGGDRGGRYGSDR